MQKISEEQVAHIKSLAAEGYNATEIADRTGVCRMTVLRRADLVVKNFGLKTHREAIESMTYADACDYLLSALEAAEAAPRRDGMMALIQAGFTSQQALLFDYLLRREGRVCSKLMLYELLTIGKSEAQLPQEKLVDVVVCHIRKKLPAGCSIKTVWGTGYFFERAPGVVLPWEPQP